MGENRRNPKVSYSLRMVAGAYLAYLGYTIARMPFKQETGLPLWAAVAIGVLLGLVGVIIAVNGFLGYRYISKHPEEFEEQTEEGAEDPEEETPEAKPVVNPSSLMSKASIPEHLRVDDEDEAEETQDDTEE